MGWSKPYKLKVSGKVKPNEKQSFKESLWGFRLSDWAAEDYFQKLEEGETIELNPSDGKKELEEAGEKLKRMFGLSYEVVPK